MDDLIVVLCTAPNTEAARSLAQAVVEGGHAACVNLVPGVQSVYRWEGKLVEDAEVLMLMKTTHQAYPALEAALRAAHPYEVPEILALPAVAALGDYAAWVGQSVASRQI